MKNLFLFVGKSNMCFLYLLIVVISIASTSSMNSQTYRWKKNNHYDYGLKSNFTSALFAPNGNQVLVYADYDKKIIDVNAYTGDSIRTFSDEFLAVSFSLDNQYIYTVKRKKVNFSTLETDIIYEEGLETIDPPFSFDAQEKSGIAIVIKNHGYKRPIPDSSIYVYDINTGKLREITGIKNRYVYFIKISPAGNTFYTFSTADPDTSKKGDEINYLSVWDSKTLTILNESPIGKGYWDFSNDGKLILNLSGETYYVLDGLTLKTINSFWYPSNVVVWAQPAISPDSKYFASGGMTGHEQSIPHIYDINTGEFIEKFFPSVYTASVRAFAFNRRNRLLIVGWDDLFYCDTKIVSINEGKRELYRYEYYKDDNEIEVVMDNSTKNNLYYEIYSYIGKQCEIQKIENNGKSLLLNISNLQPGVYFLRIQIDGQYYTEKFIKD